MTILQKTFSLALISLGLVLIYLLQPILTPFLTGIALGSLGDPLVDRLEKFRINRTLAVLIVFLVFVSVLVACLFVVLPLLARELASLILDIPRLFSWLQTSVSPWFMEYFGVDPFDLEIEKFAGHILDNWQEAGGIVGSILAQATASGLALCNLGASFLALSASESIMNSSNSFCAEASATLVSASLGLVNF